MRLLPCILLLTATVGCTTVVRYTPDHHADMPDNGIFLQYARDGRLLFKAVLRHGKYVDAWEYDRHEDLPRAVVDAVNRGERDWPTPRWIQVVHDGGGTIFHRDDAGQETGWNEVSDGVEGRGGH